MALGCKTTHDPYRAKGNELQLFERSRSQRPRSQVAKRPLLEHCSEQLKNAVWAREQAPAWVRVHGVMGGSGLVGKWKVLLFFEKEIRSGEHEARLGHSGYQGRVRVFFC